MCPWCELKRVKAPDMVSLGDWRQGRVRVRVRVRVGKEEVSRRSHDG